VSNSVSVKAVGNANDCRTTHKMTSMTRYGAGYSYSSTMLAAKMDNYEC
jgi:hypothetical protein